MTQLMLLVMQYYPLGLALLGFIAALLYEKFAPVGMMTASFATALGSGVASAAIDTQWNTVLFWSARLMFVGLLAFGTQLSNRVRGVKPYEPVLPFWVIHQQQQLLAQHPHDSAAQTLPTFSGPHVETDVEGGAAEPLEPQQNWLVFEADTSQLGSFSHNLAGQTGW
ncbi:unnamed protein product [Polarella glacialis]|jgi:hypothetical protein|uniref:Uncharacterized protein n=1 Tax=Polarella glacialis TaxID=89957 RepID=A0A813DPV9_POLGL|nr:unnamed protein product [Polarella glacialis]CAE8742130.1 unnamed protein product [Polarella glacialis]